MTEDELISEGAESVRILEDGYYVAVYRFLYNDRLIYGKESNFYDRGFCYPKGGYAHEASRVWDGKGDPPGLWIKEVGTDRYGPGMKAIK